MSRLSIDEALQEALLGALASPAVAVLITRIVRDAVHAEIDRVLHEELLDASGAARLVGSTEAAIRKAAQRGRVPSQRIGGRLRFRRAELLALGSGVPRTEL